MTNFRYANRVLKLTKSSLPPVPADVISFGSGEAFPPGLPDMAGAARQALTEFRSEVLQYAPRGGLPELRRWVAEHAGAEGISITPQHVLIINGAKHGLDLACKIFLNPGDTVVVTKPTYQTALPIFRGYEAGFVEIDQDQDGMLTDQLDERLRDLSAKGTPLPKLVYNIPEFHNPTGVTMSRDRREELVEMAGRYDMVVVEDDPYRRIRFEGVPVPPIQSFDRSGRVIGLGTFSKMIAPGLRIGWVAAAPALIERMAALKSDGGSCALTQRMILEYYRAGYVNPHISEVTGIYREHRDAMLTSLAEYVPDANVAKPQGGYYLWVRLPDHVDTHELLPIALRHGVEFIPASAFYATPGPGNYLRLCYSFSGVEAIHEGMRRFREALGAYASGR